MTSKPMPEPFQKALWRLIQTPGAPGTWNMAVDEAILQAIGKGLSPPTLRLYAWEPPCLSLGYAQPVADVDLDALQEKGWDLVRRPTGGRAILHTDELTYAVIGPSDEPRLAGSVLESYQRLSQALLEALRALGIPAVSESSASNPSAHAKGPVCFEVPSNYEITLDRKKLIGSAQARRKEGVLQHGSLPLYGDLTRITQVLRFSAEKQDTEDSLRQQAAKRLAERAITVEQCLGKRVSWKEASQAFVEAFEKVLNLELIPAELSEFELTTADELVKTKYNHASWTFRV